PGRPANGWRAKNVLTCLCRAYLVAQKANLFIRRGDLIFDHLDGRLGFLDSLPRNRTDLKEVLRSSKLPLRLCKTRSGLLCRGSALGLLRLKSECRISQLQFAGFNFPLLGFDFQSLRLKTGLPGHVEYLFNEADLFAATDGRTQRY